MFSIVTPSFKQLDWLRLCVASVRDQITGPNRSEVGNPATGNSEIRIEHIIQDAGTPEIEDFAREVGADFYRDGDLVFAATAPAPFGYSLVIYSERDAGMYDAINRGLRRSTGEICAWLNCDEQYLPGALSLVQDWFRVRPRVDVLCGDVVVTDSAGEYLCSRTALTPGSLHTLVSGNLSFLSAATFFRRRVVDAGHYLPDGWRVVGDAAWAMDLIKGGVRFETLREYLAAFADTGENLSVDEKALAEKRRLASRAPGWARAAKPLVIAHFRFRKWISGAYRLKPFSYEIFSRRNVEQRGRRSIAAPSQLWVGRR